MEYKRDLKQIEESFSGNLGAEDIIRVLEALPIITDTEDDELDRAEIILQCKMNTALDKVKIQELILALRKSSDPFTREKICYLLGKRKAKSAIAALIAQVDDPDWKLRNSAAEALMKIGGPRAGEALLRRFEGWEPVSGARRTLALALGECGCREAIPALIWALKDPDFLVRGWAAYSLGRLRANEALDAIKAACKSEPDNWAASNMYEAIALLGGVIDFPRNPSGPPVRDPTPPDGID